MSFIGTDKSPTSWGTEDGNQRTSHMRVITTSIAALGFVGAMALSAPSASAQGFYFEGPGVGIGVGRPYYGDRYYSQPYYGDRYYRSYSPYGYGGSYSYDPYAYGYSYERPYTQERRYYRSRRYRED